MKVVILCGGKGLRMRGVAEDVPKPLMKVGSRPILWHIMSLFSRAGYSEFVLPLGYKGDRIKEYFMDYSWRTRNFTLRLDNGDVGLLDKIEPWHLTFVDTGEDTMTGARIKRVEPYIDGDLFMLTYGDGLADIDIPALIEYHKLHGKAATLTGIKTRSQYGVLHVQDGMATHFVEKPGLDLLINGGFFVCNRKLFNYLSDEAGCVLEEEPLRNLIRDGELAVYEHRGFWIGIDTPKDLKDANEKWRPYPN